MVYSKIITNDFVNKGKALSKTYLVLVTFDYVSVFRKRYINQGDDKSVYHVQGEGINNLFDKIPKKIKPYDIKYYILGYLESVGQIK